MLLKENLNLFWLGHLIENMFSDNDGNIYELIDNTIYKNADNGIEIYFHPDKELREYIIDKVYEDMPF